MAYDGTAMRRIASGAEADIVGLSLSVIAPIELMMIQQLFLRVHSVAGTNRK